MFLVKQLKWVKATISREKKKLTWRLQNIKQLGDTSSESVTKDHNGLNTSLPQGFQKKKNKTTKENRKEKGKHAKKLKNYKRDSFVIDQAEGKKVKIFTRPQLSVKQRISLSSGQVAIGGNNATLAIHFVRWIASYPPLENLGPGNFFGTDDIREKTCK